MCTPAYNARADNRCNCFNWGMRVNWLAKFRLRRVCGGCSAVSQWCGMTFWNWKAEKMSCHWHDSVGILPFFMYFYRLLSIFFACNTTCSFWSDITRWFIVGSIFFLPTLAGKAVSSAAFPLASSIRHYPKMCLYDRTIRCTVQYIQDQSQP